MMLAIVHGLGLALIVYIVLSGQRRVLKAMEAIVRGQAKDYEQDYVIRKLVTKFALKPPGPAEGSPRQRREPRHIREIPRSEG